MARPKQDRTADSPAEARIRQWIADNPGIVSRAAKDLGLSAQHVHQVAFGRRVSSAFRVEHHLKTLGCPMGNIIT